MRHMTSYIIKYDPVLLKMTVNPTSVINEYNLSTRSYMTFDDLRQYFIDSHCYIVTDMGDNKFKVEPIIKPVLWVDYENNSEYDVHIKSIEKTIKQYKGLDNEKIVKVLSLKYPNVKFKSVEPVTYDMFDVIKKAIEFNFGEMFKVPVNVDKNNNTMLFDILKARPLFKIQVDKYNGATNIKQVINNK